MSKKRKNSEEPVRIFSALFDEALLYAARIHATQTRKSKKEPYIGHLLAVTSIVIAYGGDEEMAIAALLHDAVEDQGGYSRLEDINRKFGRRVARIVEGCTDAYTLPKPPWRQRKIQYIERVAKEPFDTQFVSACDKLANARDILQDLRAIGPEVYERFTGKKEGTLWYYRALVRAFERGFCGPLVQELKRTVSVLERQAKPGGHASRRAHRGSRK